MKIGKNLKMLVVGMLAMFVMVIGANAACSSSDVNAKTKIYHATSQTTEYCTELDETFTNLHEGDKVTLLISVDVGTNFIRVQPTLAVSFTFDLNGKTISNNVGSSYPVLVLNTENATMTIVDSGNTGSIIQNAVTTGVLAQKGTLILEGGTYIRNSEDGAFPVIQAGAYDRTDRQYDNKAKLVVKDGTTIKGFYGVMADGVGTVVDIQGGTIDVKVFAVSGNGSTTSNSTITISGGTLKSSSNAAIYQPQSGTLDITGGNIEGIYGIVARQGTITVKGDTTITATGDPNQTYRVGDARKNGGYVELPGGTGIIVDNTETTYPNDAKVTIENGTFNTTGSSVVTYEDPTNGDKDIIISGGDFGDDDIAEVYLAENRKQSESGVVGEVYDIEVDKTENGEVKVNKNAAVGETVKIEAIAAKGYKVGKITVTYSKNSRIENVEVKNNSFVMPEGDVNINVTFVKTADTTVNENPATYDGILTYVGLAIASLGVLTVASKKLLKNK